MTMNGTKRGPDGFRLDEPARVIPGGRIRPSVHVDRAALPHIARRERLARVLIRHDFKTPARHELATRDDVPLLRMMAEEGFASGVPPALRYQAMRVLGHLAATESRQLLEELAAAGDDEHVRGHALLALGRGPAPEPRPSHRVRRVTGHD